MSENEPDLPLGYSWQFCDIDGNDITDTPVYAVDDSVEARVWCENGDPVIVFTRSTMADPWTLQSFPGTFLRQWREGEQFDSLEQAAERFDFSVFAGEIGV